jgi:hypothetical protein
MEVRNRICCAVPKEQDTHDRARLATGWKCFVNESSKKLLAAAEKRKNLPKQVIRQNCGEIV